MDRPIPASGSDTAGKTRSTVVVATLATCGTAVSLQQTLVLPVLPDFPRLLHTTVDNASWLVTATLLAGAVATPTLSRLADMFGKKRMMLVALAVMTAGSVLGAFSQALPFIIAGRALQGIGVALIPIGIAIMRDELPQEGLALGVSVMSATLAIGAGVGPPLAGLIVEHLDWHSVFWVSAVAGTALFVAVALAVPESPVRTPGSFDYPGAVLLSAAVTALLLALSKGSHWGWLSYQTVGLIVLGLILVVAWLPVELRVRSPLVDVRVAARPAVLLVNIASVLSGFAMFANMLGTTQLLQQPAKTGYGLGLDILHTGLWMVPNALVFGAMAPVAASITRRFGPQTTLLAGASAMAAAYVARVFLSHELWQIVSGSMLVGVGTSMTFAAMPSLIMRAVPATETASANGLNTLLRSVGTSTSSATLAAIITATVIRVDGAAFPSFGAFTTMFWIAAAASFVAGMLALPLFWMGDRTADQPATAERLRDAVVRGRVAGHGGKAVRKAVVTLLTSSGQQVDWSQVDSSGCFSLAIPGAGRYLIVTAAEGWAPQSRLAALHVGQDIERIVLHDRLTLAGEVSDAHGPIAGATVALIQLSGEVVNAGHTAVDGRYEMPLPSSGRYVFTVVTPWATSEARAMTIWGTERVVDVRLRTSRDDGSACPAPGTTGNHRGDTTEGRRMSHNAAAVAPATEPEAADASALGSSRLAILAAATELFAERGYDQVTIRDIAARADLSPAMVMKCGGSKRDLVLRSAKIAPPPLPDVPRSELGTRLVEELLTRCRRGAIEPLARALNLRLSAPDPDSVRQQFTAGYLDPLAERLGGDADARLRAELVVAALTGLAASTRIFNAPATGAAPDEVVRRYGTAIQHLIDR